MNHSHYLILLLTFSAYLLWETPCLAQPDEQNKKIIKEVKTSVLYHAPTGRKRADGVMCREASPTLNLEGMLQPLNFLGKPHPIAVFNLNLMGRTSAVYSGLSWRINFNKSLFVDLSLAGAWHVNGKTKPCSHKRYHMGCKLTFREAIELGYHLNEKFLLTLFASHASNGYFIRPNPGINTIGVRLGIKL